MVSNKIVTSNTTRDGDVTYRKFYNGLEEWMDYDENHNMIHYKNSVGIARHLI